MTNQQQEVKATQSEQHKRSSFGLRQRVVDLVVSYVSNEPVASITCLVD
jgi:hypothetical protein